MKRVLIAGDALTHKNYVDALEASGVWCMASLDIKDCEQYDFDGLLLPGGGDIDPIFYGETINGSRNPDKALDEAQWAILDVFVKDEKPILGICRGHQLINVYFGGSLIQHMENSSEHQSSGGDVYHETIVKGRSFLSDIYGEGELEVNSSHHQAVKVLGEGLHAIQFCGDVIEAMEHGTLPIRCVQWHPERMENAKKDVAVMIFGMEFESEKC